MKTVLLLLVFSVLLPFSALAQNRSYDGSMNNLNQTNWGAAGGDITRVVTNGYADGISEPGMTDYPNPRTVSNELFDQTESLPNDLNISDFGWAFGQFIDHDITFVDDQHDEFISIPVPVNDPFFDPSGTGTAEIFMRRSKYDPATGTGVDNPRTHVNDITAWIDASNVYGSDENRAHWLRTFSGGKLKTSEGRLLPFNTTTGKLDGDIDLGAPFMLIEGAPMPKHFVAGDLRANEQPILICMHTLFVREHNRLCDEISITHPNWNDEEIYQMARKMVGAYIQSIVYYEWLPVLGIPIDDYQGYDENANPNIMNVFSAAAFRLGHTLLNGHLIRLDNNGDTIAQGSINLKDAFFNPFVVKDEGGIEPFFKGMATQPQQTFDAKVISDVRNFLFGPPGAGGLDLVAINLNRGRERGLPDYNTIRTDFGMGPVSSFAEITSDAEVQATLASLYGSVDAIDPWAGMLSEDHVPGAAVGSTVQLILQHQYEDLRDGDRFYFENDPALSPAQIDEIKNIRLSDIILRNTEITILQEDVFYARPHDDTVGIAENEISPATLSVYPNPVRDELTISIEANQSSEGQLNLFNINGQLLRTESIYIKPGQQQFSHQLEKALPAGIYQVSVLLENGEVLNEKLVKM